MTATIADRYHIAPPDLPNDGERFVDHDLRGRSGHGGQCLVQCSNGDLLAFYSNTAADVWDGHSAAGWTEYRRSTDGGTTWGDPQVLEYSRAAWEREELCSALVFGVTAAPDGTLIAIVCRFATPEWIKADTPVYLTSADHGETWSAPRPLDPTADLTTAALTFDATFVHGREVFVVVFGDTGNMAEGTYNLYVSDDNGDTFRHRSTLPFDPRNYYVTGGVLDDSDLIVYSYPFRGADTTDERAIEYVRSADGGRSWSSVDATHVAKKLRNPQLSAKLGDRYFMHGRSGSYGTGSGRLVLYTSVDGIAWDEGTILYEDGQSDCYSANVVVGGDRLLIQSSINYDPDTKCVNERHWWVTDESRQS